MVIGIARLPGAAERKRVEALPYPAPTGRGALGGTRAVVGAIAYAFAHRGGTVGADDGTGSAARRVVTAGSRRWAAVGRGDA